MNAPVQASSTIGTFLKIIGAPLLMAAGLIFWLKTSTPETGGLSPGSKAPAITAEGWQNGNAPEPRELAGKVIVVHAWFNT